MNFALGELRICCPLISLRHWVVNWRKFVLNMNGKVNYRELARRPWILHDDMNLHNAQTKQFMIFQFTFCMGVSQQFTVLLKSENTSIVKYYFLTFLCTSSLIYKDKHYFLFLHTSSCRLVLL